MSRWAPVMMLAPVVYGQLVLTGYRRRESRCHSTKSPSSSLACQNQDWGSGPGFDSVARVLARYPGKQGVVVPLRGMSRHGASICAANRWRLGMRLARACDLSTTRNWRLRAFLIAWLICSGLAQLLDFFGYIVRKIASILLLQSGIAPILVGDDSSTHFCSAVALHGIRNARMSAEQHGSVVKGDLLVDL